MSSPTGFDLENQQIEKAKLDVMKQLLKEIQEVNESLKSFVSMYSFINKVE